MISIPLTMTGMCWIGDSGDDNPKPKDLKALFQPLMANGGTPHKWFSTIWYPLWAENVVQ